HKPFINGWKNHHPFDARLMLVVSFGVIPHLNTCGNVERPCVVQSRKASRSLQDLKLSRDISKLSLPVLGAYL
ncbi:MAG: hypothetical protein WAM07_09455, partial [Halobacillus sp.]|uniref:hypothetical protein n=1 Tax=Halobacillus sp. TaxID=56800 RepID=UPI003BAEAA25